MLRFEQHYNRRLSLHEGGNVRVKKGTGMGGNVNVSLETAHKIPIDELSKTQFVQFKNEITTTLKALNKAFEKQTGEALWSNIDSLIETGRLFSGSTRLLFTKALEDLKKYKKKVGDIDLQYPEEKKGALKEFLTNSEDQKFGDMTYFGMGGNSPIQFNTIFKTTSLPDDVTNIQVDFEPTIWEDGEPTEFSTYAHYSSWEDVQSQVKGAFSKLLMRSLTSNKERLGDVAVVTPTGKISTAAKYDNPGMRGFSVDKGLRVKYEPVLDDRGEQQKTDDGRPMYKEIPTKDSNYERDLADIFGFLFGQEPTEDEKHLMHSYIGILKLMKKYLDDDSENDVFDGFMKIIWGDMAQEIEQGEFKDGINTEDFSIKHAAYDQFVKVFPELRMSEEELLNYVRPFYDKLAKKKIQK